jgi:hypothetical protein
MKKFYFTLFIICIVHQFSHAQNEIGLKGGLNFSRILIEEPEPFSGGGQNDSFKMGYHIGLFSSFKLTTNIFLAPELLVSEKGAKNLAATYITIPTLVNVRIIDRFFIEAGPEFDILLIDGSFGNKYHFPVWDKGLKISLDIGLKTKITEKLNANLRYNYGLSSVMEIPYTNEKGEPLEGKAYNRSLQLSLGYKILN